MHIDVNQVGFDTHAPKRAVYRTPTAAAAGEFRILTESGKVVLRGDLGADRAISPWSCHTREVDFTELETLGRFQVAIGECRSPFFRIGPGEPGHSTLHEAVEFFFIQRCGMAVPGWHGPCHLNDALLPDGTYRDAAGGWHDAGDYNKYNGHSPVAAFALFSMAQQLPEFFVQRERQGRPATVDEALWGTAWIAKMVDPESGMLWRDVFSGYSYWGTPEAETDNQIGSEKSRRFRHEHEHDRHPELAVAVFCLADHHDGTSPKWRDTAFRLWNTTGTLADLTPMRKAGAIMAGLALHRMTGDSCYLEAAEEVVRLLVASQQPDGSFNPVHLVDQGLAPAALAAASLERPEWKDVILPSLDRYFQRSYELSNNPYGILQCSSEDYFFNYKTPETWYVGQNSMYLSQAWAAALYARLSGDSQALRHAQDQIDWVVGRNPYGICMMEGVGTVHTPRYHHRYDALPGHETGAVPGAITNGIVRESPERDAPHYDLRTDVRTAYQTNEPWIPHNAYYLLAAAALWNVGK